MTRLEVPITPATEMYKNHFFSSLNSFLLVRRSN